MMHKVYYRSFLYIGQINHYRWYIYCKKRDDGIGNGLNPLFIELDPTLGSYYDPRNPHPKVVKILLQYDLSDLGSNIHPKIVEKYIESGKIDNDFSYNPSNLSTNFWINHSYKIDWGRFLQNENPRAVDHCIQMWDELSEYQRNYLSWNWSQKTVDWLVNNPKFIHFPYIRTNPFNYEVNRLKYIKSKRFLVDVVNP